ncbi:MAG TPA: dienelactone hydrolase family protein [Roseiarcus sp.]|nr:dienelactone hydrolase family protein [Roseiarcus sp.]
MTDAFAPPRVDRRMWVKGSLSVGFCAAISPVFGQTIVTPSEGLIAGEVKLSAGDVDIPAYRAMPDGGGKFPTVLVIHEIFGVHEHIKDVCRRWAKLGYYAIAPELFARQGDAAAEKDMQKLMADIVAKKPDSEVLSDLDATVAFAKASGSADLDRAAVTGFCWGGRQTWLYAAHNPSLKAGVAWYGPLAGKTSELRPKNPPDIVAELKVPVLGLYGGMDKGITHDQIAAMQKKLADAGGSKIIVYDDAGHAFYADYRPSYVKADAEASWKEATAWLKAHGV